MQWARHIILKVVGGARIGSLLDEMGSTVGTSDTQGGDAVDDTGGRGRWETHGEKPVGAPRRPTVTITQQEVHAQHVEDELRWYRSSRHKSSKRTQSSDLFLATCARLQGNQQHYEPIKRLQSCMFGAVYEVQGDSTKQRYAVKLLLKKEVERLGQTRCEKALNEVAYAKKMRGHKHVIELVEYFEKAGQVCLVFPLCRGGDLLEALRRNPFGFYESEVQAFIRQAGSGLAFLHDRCLAMQDVSLENMLLHIDEKGFYQVKICDPGQAVIFTLDGDEREMAVEHSGYVGKSFRPPEIYDQSPYVASLVDAWCLGWSTYYLITATPLFLSANLFEEDKDYRTFLNGDLRTTHRDDCSEGALALIQELMQVDPDARMSVTKALQNPWLLGPSQKGVRAKNREEVSPSAGLASQVMENTYLGDGEHVEAKQEFRVGYPAGAESQPGAPELCESTTSAYGTDVDAIVPDSDAIVPPFPKKLPHNTFGDIMVRVTSREQRCSTSREQRGSTAFPNLCKYCERKDAQMQMT